MQDASKIENKIVPLMDTLTNGILDNNEKEYFLNKIFLWTEDLNAKSNYKNAQINRWIDKLITIIDDKDYDEYYYVGDCLIELCGVACKILAVLNENESPVGSGGFAHNL